jgi:heptaprenyl diphosphate synthase
MRRDMKIKRIAFLGISVALAMVFSYIEHLVPPLVAIPGIKIGFANIVVIFLLYKIGWREAGFVSIIRVLLASLLFGNVQVFAFSLAGAALSLAGMALVKRYGDFSCITVSILGGVLHNVGQIAIAVLWTQTGEIIYYLPILLISGVFAGAIIGIVSAIVVQKTEKLKI